MSDYTTTPSILSVVFDLDGVLIDSEPCMQRCWEAVIADTGVSTVSFQSYFSNIGRPFKEILTITGFPKDLQDRAHTVYFEAQRSYNHLIKEFDEATAVLRVLSGSYMLGLVTSKPQSATALVLHRFGWGSLFDFVVTPDVCPNGKPKPDPLLMFADLASVPPKHCVYVGDMEVDMKSATAAGFQFIHATWGYQPSIACVQTVNNLSSLQRYLMK